MSKRAIDLNDPGARIWETNNLDDHVGLIRRQVQKSLADPETHKLARGLFTGRDRVTAWGKVHRCAPCTNITNDTCVINTVWNFCVLNVEYEHDPPDYDLFCTVRRTLFYGLGDCDDSTIVLCSLLKALGFSNTLARVISTDNEVWQHVYTMVSRGRRGGPLVALDPTVKGSTPGWEYAGSKQYRDFAM
jgi:hypothetical protein